MSNVLRCRCPNCYQELGFMLVSIPTEVLPSRNGNSWPLTCGRMRSQMDGHPQQTSGSYHGRYEKRNT